MSSLSQVENDKRILFEDKNVFWNDMMEERCTEKKGHDAGNEERIPACAGMTCR